MPEDLALNTAVSFVTNTNWQNYAGESTMAHLTQAVGLAVQNFVSAAVGLAIAIALMRGITRRTSPTIGNFWTDLIRATLYVLLPIAFVAALVLVWQGVPQTFGGPATVTGLEGGRRRSTSARSPRRRRSRSWAPTAAASSTPTPPTRSRTPPPLTNLLEQVLILVIPFSLTATFGVLAGDRRQGWAIFAAMARHPRGRRDRRDRRRGTAANPLFPAGIDQALGNMEGKELRFGASGGGLWAAITTGTSTGAVNAMHDSLTPLGGLVPAVPDAPRARSRRAASGAGLYGMLVFALLTVFIAGPHGRPHAGVPGQEGRDLRDEDEHARRARPLGEHPRLHRARDRDRRRARPGRSTRVRTASARSSTRSPARPATTARRSAA